MEAGAELDELVAEKVMGWKRLPDCGGLHEGDACKMDQVPDYSTDMAAAWPIAERLRLSVSPHGESQWGAGQPQPSPDEPDTFDTDLEVADTAPLAICLAALRLTGMPLRALGDLTGETDAG